MLSESEANTLSRELQDAIFYGRLGNPFVFDWIYRLLRNKYEDQMKRRGRSDPPVVEVKVSDTDALVESKPAAVREHTHGRC